MSSRTSSTSTPIRLASHRMHLSTALHKFAICAILLMGSYSSACAANRYIRAGATGAKDGSSWANAWPTLAAVTWTRGDTYYIAGGTYDVGSQIISKAESGSLWIKIKKANAADNSGDVGWNSVYASQQAVINGRITIQGSYFEIDGVTGSGEQGHGIKIQDLAMQGMGTVLLYDGNGGPVRLFHLEMRNGIPKAPTGINVLWDNGAVKKGLHIAYCWIHSCSKDGTSFNNLRGTSYSDYGLLFEHNVLSETGGALNLDHGQGMKFSTDSKFIIIRNNKFRNVTGTAFIAFLGIGQSFSHVQIENNVFYKTDLINFPLSSPGIIFGRDTVTCTNFTVKNNTFWGLGTLSNTYTLAQIVLDGPTSGASGTNALINNVWENSFFSGTGHRGFSTNSNNGYYGNFGNNSTSIPQGTTNQVNGSATTFVNAAAGDFRLASGGYAIGKGTNSSDLGAALSTYTPEPTHLPAPSNTRVVVQ